MRPGDDRDFTELFQRVEDLERVKRSYYMPWVAFQSSQRPVTIANGADFYPEISGLKESPINYSSEPPDVQDILQIHGLPPAADVYSGILADDSEVELIGTNEPFKYLRVKQPGLYYVECSAAWWPVWGPAVVNLRFEAEPSGGGPGSDGFLNLRVFEQWVTHSTANSLIYSGGPSIQYDLIDQTYIAVDERNTDLRIRFSLTNQSGSSQTLDNTFLPFWRLAVIRLSEVGHSNPR